MEGDAILDYDTIYIFREAKMADQQYWAYIQKRIHISIQAYRYQEEMPPYDNTAEIALNQSMQKIYEAQKEYAYEKWIRKNYFVKEDYLYGSGIYQKSIQQDRSHQKKDKSDNIDKSDKMYREDYRTWMSGGLNLFGRGYDMDKDMDTDLQDRVKPPGYYGIYQGSYYGSGNIGADVQLVVKDPKNILMASFEPAWPNTKPLMRQLGEKIAPFLKYADKSGVALGLAVENVNSLKKSYGKGISTKFIIRNGSTLSWDLDTLFTEGRPYKEITKRTLEPGECLSYLGVGGLSSVRHTLRLTPHNQNFVIFADSTNRSMGTDSVALLMARPGASLEDFHARAQFHIDLGIELKGVNENYGHLHASISHRERDDIKQGLSTNESTYFVLLDLQHVFTKYDEVLKYDFNGVVGYGKAANDQDLHDQDPHNDHFRVENEEEDDLVEMSLILPKIYEYKREAINWIVQSGLEFVAALYAVRSGCASVKFSRMDKKFVVIRGDVAVSLSQARVKFIKLMTDLFTQVDLVGWYDLFDWSLGK